MNDENLQSDDPRVKTAENNVLILDEWIQATEKDAPRSDDKWLVTSLLKSARRCYDHLRNGWMADSTYTAWACRNLFELSVIAKYVTESAKNRQRFIFDWLNDFKEEMEVVKKLTMQIVPGEGLKEHDLILDRLQDVTTKLGFVETDYLRIRTLAKKVGLETEFSIMYKLSSKLVHPTALAVMAIESEDQNQSTRDILMLKGFSYMAGLITDIAPLARALADPSRGSPQAP